MSRKVVGAVAALLLAMFAVVYAPLSKPVDHPAAPSAAIMLASGVGLSPGHLHPTPHNLSPPGPGIAPPGPGTRVAPLPPTRGPVTRTVNDDSSPRAPPSNDL
ncbi:hypothetical protein [Streptosporangium lutulentum]|uniref:Uncharacterized protein n=1 Tax=Streptosporangium lutulentum TaxID=1461250 RepID=A0ABT9QJ71_9ACTN|nr:hypothetical protein [Streptosporangium lutulentum]MDP9845994.1 hypothetical protein [Streptosporangium lutulentum]